jgi:hypothetical protein
LFARKSRRSLEELVLGSGPSDIVIDSTVDRDSVFQFVLACHGSNLDLTLSNIFDIEVLCDDWSVDAKSIRQELTDFIEHGPRGQGLLLRRLCFRFSRGLSTSEAEDSLRRTLVDFVSDSVAQEISEAVLSRTIKFRDYEG